MMCGVPASALASIASSTDAKATSGNAKGVYGMSVSSNVYCAKTCAMGVSTIDLPGCTAQSSGSHGSNSCSCCRRRAVYSSPTAEISCEYDSECERKPARRAGTSSEERLRGGCGRSASMALSTAKMATCPLDGLPLESVSRSMKLAREDGAATAASGSMERCSSAEGAATASESEWCENMGKAASRSAEVGTGRCLVALEGAARYTSTSQPDEHSSPRGRSGRLWEPRGNGAGGACTRWCRRLPHTTRTRSGEESGLVSSSCGTSPRP
mmetsp:Transcript_12633/g.31506  ORF Transcript_12633/g.31506 Transcript_12633/m.31506 type:complete len:269 (+) Transcript_12633:3789-4595(+)